MMIEKGVVGKKEKMRRIMENGGRNSQREKEMYKGGWRMENKNGNEKGKEN